MKRLFFNFLLLFLSVNIFCQKKLTTEQYIQKYKYIAIREMKRCGIPASITLAQGSLESGNGNSRLATDGNNHFGIKCHDWKGKKIYEDDDRKHECFRKYRNVEESFRDHSDFLTSNSRYAFLFELKTTDYKGWARGLKRVGYATSPTYAQALIRIIEEHKLNKYDKGYKGEIDKPVTTTKPPKSVDLTDEGTYAISLAGREIHQNNRIDYVLAKEGETFADIAKEMDLLSWELPNYNGLSRNAILKKDQIVYLQPKRSKAEAGKKIHVVEEGESMWDISQKYGVKLKKLYSKNHLEPGTEVKVGEEIYLRKKKELPEIVEQETEIEE